MLMASDPASPPMRFSFGTPPKAIMEFTAKPNNDKPEDVFSKCDLDYIQLYAYDWTITNFSMIKAVSEPITSPTFVVGPFQNLKMRSLLWRTGNESIKIEFQVLKEVKLTDEMKAKEADCPLSTKFTKNTLDLEFLDSSGKIIDYYMSIPYEFKYINTSRVHAWIREENISRFLNKDSFTIRAKLSIRYYSEPADAIESSDLKSTRVFMNDMKNMFLDRNRFPDIVVEVGGQFIVAHKAVLYTQCPHFAKMAKSDDELSNQNRTLNLPSNVTNILKEDFDTVCIPNEKADVFLSVLHFIYCKKLYATDSVNDFAVYEFAKRYGVRELSMLLMPSEMKARSEIEIEKLNYTWYVKNFSSLCKGAFSSPIQSPNFKTENAADVTWSVVALCLDSQNVTLNLQRNSGINKDIQTKFKLAVCKADGSVHEEREFEYLFSSLLTASHCHPGLLGSSRFVITPDLLHNDILTITCDLTLSTGGIHSELRYVYPAENPDIDLAYWTKNFKDLLEKQTFSDATLIVDDKEFKIHKVILSARSPVFGRMFESDMEEKRSGCARISDISSAVMEQTLLYAYTGETPNLTMEQAPELYRTADKYEIMDLKSRCSEFILQNMDVDSACEVMILANLYGDEKMKKAAKNIICRNAPQTLLSLHGTELLMNHSLLAHDILESLSAAYCSLPPQDMHEKPHGIKFFTSHKDRKFVRADRVSVPFDSNSSRPVAFAAISTPSTNSFHVVDCEHATTPGSNSSSRPVEQASIPGTFSNSRPAEPKPVAGTGPSSISRAPVYYSPSSRNNSRYGASGSSPSGSNNSTTGTLFSSPNASYSSRPSPMGSSLMGSSPNASDNSRSGASGWSLMEPELRNAPDAPNASDNSRANFGNASRSPNVRGLEALVDSLQTMAVNK